jgi:hypothetical protein
MRKGGTSVRINGIEGNRKGALEAEVKREDRPRESDRREFLEKYGKLAIYTPPAIMALMFYGERSAEAGSCFSTRESRRNRHRSRRRRRMN